MQLRQPPETADVLVVLGSIDDRVAKYAALLLHNETAPKCIITGGLAHNEDLLATKYGKTTESDHFSHVMEHEGIQRKDVFLETEATSTWENALFSYKILADSYIEPKSLLLVTKPYMERRALATFEAQWPKPGVSIGVTSAGGKFDDYCNEEQPVDIVVNLMVGDYQRIVEYPKRGWQTHPPANRAAEEAFKVLVTAGYTKHLLHQYFIHNVV